MEELVYTGITRCRSNLFLLDMGHHSIGRKLKGILETSGH
jgi:ATP-dependent exoDNAse (exonuclease V) alpha subunit